MTDSPIQYLDEDEVALSSYAYQIYHHQIEGSHVRIVNSTHPLASLKNLSDFCEILFRVSSFLLESKLFIHPEKFRHSNSPKYKESQKQSLFKFIGTESNRKLHAIFTRVYHILDHYPQNLALFLKWLQGLYCYANLEFDPYPELGKVVQHFHSDFHPTSATRNSLTEPMEASWKQELIDLPWLKTHQKFYLQYLTLSEVLSLHLIQNQIEMAIFINQYLPKKEQMKLFLYPYLYQPLEKILIEIDTLEDDLKLIYSQIDSDKASG